MDVGGANFPTEDIRDLIDVANRVLLRVGCRTDIVRFRDEKVRSGVGEVYKTEEEAISKSKGNSKVMNL